MLITPHFLTGVVIASQVPEIAPAALMAITSHYILDTIPHRDYFDKKYLTWRNIILTAIDGLISLGLFYWLIPQAHWGYYFGIGALAMLPDVISLPGAFWGKWWKLPLIKPLHNWHTEVLQYAWGDQGWGIGLLPQIIIIGAAIYFLR